MSDTPETRPDLDAIRARADAALTGPWEFEHGEWKGKVGAPHLGAVVAFTGNHHPSGEFIAHAREDVPALLAALAAERARADQAEQRIADAPHETECEVNRTEPSDHSYDDQCNCWKSAAPTTEPSDQ